MIGLLPNKIIRQMSTPTLEERIWIKKGYTWFRVLLFHTDWTPIGVYSICIDNQKKKQDGTSKAIPIFQLKNGAYIYNMNEMLQFGRIRYGLYHIDDPMQVNIHSFNGETVHYTGDIHGYQIAKTRFTKTELNPKEFLDILDVNWITPIFKGSGWIDKILMGHKFTLILTSITLFLILFLMIKLL